MTDDTLRSRLLALRADVLDRLAEADGIDGGMLALLGNVGASLDALDAVPLDAEPADRVVIANDGREIQLMVYVAGGTVAVVTVSPRRAIGLAAELLASASPKLFVPGGV